MKQINSLIVCEVPKEAVSFKISGSNHICWKALTDMMWNTLDPLPPGQYEIIGLYSEVERNISLQDVACVAIASDHLFETLWQNELIPTDTNDLLFIHKLK